MFGISGFELLMIAAFALIVFGPDQLPKFGRTVGRFMRDFKRTQEEMEAMMRAELYGEPKRKTGSSATPDMPGMGVDEEEPVSRAGEWADDDDEEEEEEEL